MERYWRGELKIIRERQPDLPFIIVSGKIGEETAVEVMKNGANDYVKKGNLGRIIPAIKRELQAASAYRECRIAEEALRISEERFRLLAENAQDIVYRYRLFPTRGFEYVSPSATVITGYTPQEHYADADPDLGFKMVHPDDRALFQEVTSGKNTERLVALRWVRQDGTIIWIEQRNVPVYDRAGNLTAVEGTNSGCQPGFSADVGLSYPRVLVRNQCWRLLYGPRGP